MIAGLTLNYRRPDLTMACVHSLLDDGVMPVLVWDNSDDAGASSRLLEQTFGDEPSVHVVTSPGNLGFAAGVNAGLQWLAKEEGATHVLVINNDATIVRGSTQLLATALAAAPSAAMAVPTIIEQGREQGWMYYQRTTGLIFRSHWPGTFPYASGCCCLFDVTRIGVAPYDEDFFMYGEDAELSWRLARMNIYAVNVSTACVIHRVAASSGLGSEFYEHQVVRAHLLMSNKLSDTRLQRDFYKGCRLISLFLRAVVRSLRFRNMLPIKAYLAALR